MDSFLVSHVSCSRVLGSIVDKLLLASTEPPAYLTAVSGSYIAYGMEQRDVHMLNQTTYPMTFWRGCSDITKEESFTPAAGGLHMYNLPSIS